MSLGQNVGTILVTGAQNPVVVVQVTESTIGVSPSSVNLGTYEAGSRTYPAAQTLNVAGPSGQSAGNFTVTAATGDTWYTAAKYGSTSSSVLIQFNPLAAAALTASTTPLQGTLTITPAGNNPVPVSVPISLTVTTSPQVSVSPAAGLVFNWQSGGTNNQQKQYLTLTSNAGVPISFSATVGQGATWLQLPFASQNGSIPAGGSTTLEVDVNGDVQPALPINASIQITISAGALFPNGSSQLSFPVQLNVSSFQQLYATPVTLSYSYQFGSVTTPALQLVNVTSSGEPFQTMQYNVVVSSTNTPWLTIIAAGTLTTPTPFVVGVNTTGLSPSTYVGSVTVTPVPNGSNQGPIVIPVTLTVSFNTILQVSATQLVFPYQVGQTAPTPQTVTLSSSTGAPLIYTVTPPTVSWLQVTGALTGTTDETSITVSIIPSGVTTSQTMPLDTTIAVIATDPVTGLVVSRQSIDVKLYADTNSVLMVYPPGPLQFVTYPSASGYPIASSCGGSLPLCTISLTSSSPASGDTLSISAAWETVAWVGQTGNWLRIGTAPGATTPTLLTLNATQLSTSIMTPGTYSGTVSITANSPNHAVVDSQYTVPVNFVVAAAKVFVTTQQTDGSIQFTQTQGGTAPPAQTVVVTTDSASQFPFAVVANTGLLGWLTVSQVNGPTPGSFIVSVDGSKLTAGTYNGAIYITVPNATPNPFRIPVTFTVGGTIAASQASLSFQQVLGGPSPVPQTIQITSSPSMINYSVSASVGTTGSWLSANITAGSGATPGTVAVSVNATGLGLGSYSGTLTITSPGATNTPLSVPVTLSVVQATISAPTTPLTFTQLAGGPAPASQTVAVTATPGPVAFTVAATTDTSVPWLAATISSSGSSGTTPTMVKVSVSAANLSPRSYTGVVTISSPSATGSPINIPVGLTVGTAGALTVSPTSISFNAPVGQLPQQQAVTLASTVGMTYSVSADANWLAASPPSGTLGTTPVTLTISASTQSMAAGSYSGTLTISSPNLLTPVTVGVSLTLQSIPTPVIIAVVNAASYLPGAVSPGENVVITGTGIGPPQLVGPQLTTAGAISTNLGNTQVLFDGVAAPVMYASATQTSVMVPYGIAGRPTTSIQVVYSGVPSAPLSYSVTAAAPGIYTQNQRGFGPGVILNSDNVSVNGPGAPAAPGSIVVVYMTGEGVTSPSSITGAIAGTSGNGLNQPVAAVTATIGGASAPIVYCGSAPDVVYGIMQVNVLIPPATPSGAQPLVINIGSTPTQSGVTVQVQ
jgi:uncharacterized protein (TIGR03437 family)